MSWFRARKVSTVQDELEKAGTEIVRTLLYDAMSNPADLPGVLERIRHSSEERRAAMEWLHRKERKAKINARVVTVASIVAAVAACIAAWPIVQEWLTR
jgi:hypothetical protein